MRTTVPPDMKVQAKAIANREFLSEAAWLKRIVMREIRAAEGPGSKSTESRTTAGVRQREIEASGSNGGGKPIYVRLRSGDRLLLDARATARGLRPATYLSVLARAHLRAMTPLPKNEFLALTRCISELAAIGRNINQIVKAANQGGRLPRSAHDEFRAMLKICEALRDSTKALLKANETSWSTGND